MKAYLRKDNRYECRIQRTIAGKKRKYSFYGATAEIAVEKCRIFKETVLDKSHMKPHRDNIGILTVSNLIDEWFEQKRLIHKESTRANYRTKASKHIIPVFDGICVYDLTHQKVNEFACKLIDKELSVNYVRSIMVLFKSIIAYGVRAYGLNISLDLIALPSREYKERDIYSHEEVAKLFRYAWSIRTITAIAVILAIGFGLRIGEICGLKWSDIDFDSKILHIRRTVQRISCRDRDKKTKVICTTPKSRSSIRDRVHTYESEGNKIKVISRVRFEEFGTETQQIDKIAPFQFLTLINHADCILTDSFHGVVFSLIFEKEFLVFSRNYGKHISQSSRIISFLKELGIEDRYIEDDATKSIIIKNLNYSKINAIIEYRRKESSKFLENVFNSQEHERD